tara:strand:- start:284 stop:424 length:141 start_codon:yes stop_codon:yes gene_type:complete
MMAKVRRRAISRVARALPLAEFSSVMWEMLVAMDSALSSAVVTTLG